MKADEKKDRSRGIDGWLMGGIALLIAGVLAIMFWGRSSDVAQSSQNPEISGVSQNLGNLSQDPSDADPGTSTVETNDPSKENTDSLNGTSGNDQQTQTTTPDDEQSNHSSVAPSAQQLICEDIGLFNGAFVEDGSDEPVQNVVALLITNGSEQYLDLAKLTYEIDGQEAVFMVTGLPAGGTAWVLENSRMTASAESEFCHKNTITSFRENAVSTLEGVNLAFNGTMLKATNTTNKTFKALTIYYKVLHDDGNYLGGIAYMVSFGDLEPGQSAEKIAGHFQPDKAHIVRIGYQEE